MSKAFPTAEQQLLLQASLFKGEKGMSAWKKWQSMKDWDDLDAGSLRLIPLLYRNLMEQDVREPVMSRYKGIYQSYWARNQLLFHSVEPVLAALREAGIEVMFFKGVALLLGLDLDTALRPMDDVDIIVRPEDFHKASLVINKLGWLPRTGDRHIINEATKDFSFQNGKGQFLDVHLHPLLYARWGAHEMEIWERAQQQSFRGIPVRVMDHTNHLVHIIVHGLARNPVPPVRWGADATMLLNDAACPVQWGYLVEQSKTLRTTFAVAAGLRYLKENLAVRVPEDVILALEREVLSLPEKAAYRLRMEPLLSARFNDVLLHAFIYWAYRPELPFPGILRYFQARWGLNHVWQVPYVGFRKSLTTVKQALPKKASPRRHRVPGRGRR